MEPTTEPTTVVLKTTQTQRGRTIPSEWVFRDEQGRWFHEGIVCWGSEWHGLGGCRCETHDSTFSDEVSDDQAQRLLATAPSAADAGPPAGPNAGPTARSAGAS